MWQTKEENYPNSTKFSRVSISLFNSLHENLIPKFPTTL